MFTGACRQHFANKFSRFFTKRITNVCFTSLQSAPQSCAAANFFNANSHLVSCTIAKAFAVSFDKLVLFSTVFNQLKHLTRIKKVFSSRAARGGRTFSSRNQRVLFRFKVFVPFVPSAGAAIPSLKPLIKIMNSRLSLCVEAISILLFIPNFCVFFQTLYYRSLHFLLIWSFESSPSRPSLRQSAQS